jgi:hypothetical protein
MSEADHFAQERRWETRLDGFYPLLVRVKNAEGQQIKAHTLADNLCSGGLYFQFPQALSADAHLFTLIHLSKGIRIAACGRVLRNEPKPHGMSGMAIRFSHTRIIPLPKQYKMISTIPISPSTICTIFIKTY